MFLAALIFIAAVHDLNIHTITKVFIGNLMYVIDCIKLIIFFSSLEHLPMMKLLKMLIIRAVINVCFLFFL